MFVEMKWEDIGEAPSVAPDFHKAPSSVIITAALEWTPFLNEDFHEATVFSNSDSVILTKHKE